jgi:hypothetical protein
MQADCQRKKIWQPIHFDTRWNDVQTVRFDNIRPSWDKKRLDLSKNPEQYTRFIDQLKRKQAVDTGIIERLYDLKRGVTETLIKEGFADSYLQHGDSNIEPELLMGYIKDNFEALDYVFDFIKNSRELTVFYIRGLHQLITRHQNTIEAVDSFGNRGETPLLKGEFKKLPNNPMRDGIVYEYCPPEQVDSEMDNFDLIKERGDYFGGNLKSNFGTADIALDASDSTNEHYYSFQIAQYAKEHQYYFNSSLPRRWIRIRMYFDRQNRYQLVLSLHHYGYDNSTFAIGAFIEKEEVIEGKTGITSQAQHNEIYTALGVPPLVFSSEKEISALRESIYQQLDAIITSALGYIAEELT